MVRKCQKCGESLTYLESSNKWQCWKCGKTFILKERNKSSPPPPPPPPPEEELSESGAKIYRHKERKREFEHAIGDEDNINLISDHVEKHIGKISWVIHEIVSDLVHVDIFHVKPTKERNYHKLITCGMSSRPMKTPEEVKEFRFAELMMFLPPSWPLSEATYKDPNVGWPLTWMGFLARFPHALDTWLGYGHTVPNGDPPEPFIPSTRLCCWLLYAPPPDIPDEFVSLKVNEKKSITFYFLVPLHVEEMVFKLKYGLESLMEKFDEGGVSMVLDVGRGRCV